MWHDSDDYKAGYVEGLAYGYARWTQDYCDMDYDRQREFDRGVHDGREERWRRDDENDW